MIIKKKVPVYTNRGLDKDNMEKTVVYYEDKVNNAKLIIWSNQGIVGVHNIKEGCVLGRKCADSTAEVQIDSALVSRKHGEIFFSKGEYYYRDLDSLNGTYINGCHISKSEHNNVTSIPLNNGDVLRIDYKEKGKCHKDAVVIIFTTSLEYENDWDRLCLSDSVSEIPIGRDYSSINISSNLISKKHGVFFRAHKGWAVEDTNSTNGVFLNGIKIEKAQYLYPLDVIRMGNLFFFYDGEKLWYPIEKNYVVKKKNNKAGKGNHLEISIKDRTVRHNFKKLVLLQDINMTIHSGEMVLILGGSGAGKTTFMNAVMGYEKANGTICYGKTDIYREYEKMKYEIGFVPQQDLLRGSDTVYDTLRNAAQMKMPKSITPVDMEKRIKEVMELLGLSREKNSLVDKLSGGQRKRLSIAVEFIANPGLFFLDEPDSGLDGIMARELMKNLRTIADSGKIVMVITHGPDRAPELFDKVVVLAKSTSDNCGHLAFYGSVEEAYRFFETNSLEGVVKRVNRTDEGGEGKSDYFIDKFNRMSDRGK